MGYSTDFIGSVRIVPPLNDHESVGVARVEAVERRPEVERLLRWRVVGLGDLQSLEGDPQGLERLAGEGRGC